MTTKIKNSPSRDEKWLLYRLDDLWSRYFSDVLQTNRVYIRFGRFAKLRLGSIKFDKKSGDTTITITSMFKDNSIPGEVVDHTIAHELIHYSHGFSSPHPRLHKYPHEGGVIKREILKRGMGELYKAYYGWIKKYRQLLRKHYG